MLAIQPTPFGSGDTVKRVPSFGAVGVTNGPRVGAKTALGMGVSLAGGVCEIVGGEVMVGVGLRNGAEVETARASVVFFGAKNTSDE